MVIDVARGLTQALRITVNDEVATWQNFDITADDTLEAKIFAIDAKGNQWAVPETFWFMEHPTVADPSNFLEVSTGDSTTFSPYYASDDDYMLIATYVDAQTNLSVSINITVGHGALHSVTMAGVANDALQSTGDQIELTADHAVDLSAELYDADNNPISADELTWVEVNVETGAAKDITTQPVSYTHLTLPTSVTV